MNSAGAPWTVRSNVPRSFSTSTSISRLFTPAAAARSAMFTGSTEAYPSAGMENCGALAKLSGQRVVVVFMRV